MLCGRPMPRPAFPRGTRDRWSHPWGQRDRAVHLLCCSWGKGRLRWLRGDLLWLRGNLLWLRVADFAPAGRQDLLLDLFSLPRWLQLTTGGRALSRPCAETMLSGSWSCEPRAGCPGRRGQTRAPSWRLTFPVLRESCSASSYSPAAANPSASPMPSGLRHTLSSPVRPAQVCDSVRSRALETCLYSRAQRLGFWSRAWSKPASECNRSQKLLILISATGDDC